MNPQEWERYVDRGEVPYAFLQINGRRLSKTVTH